VWSANEALINLRGFAEATWNFRHVLQGKRRIIRARAPLIFPDSQALLAL
jgi:hypothetical protein